VKGYNKLMRQLTDLAHQASKLNNTVAQVSYTADYAIHVHEDLMVPHSNGEAKFLEKPMRRMLNDGTLAKVMNDAIKAGRTIPQAMLLAALRLQRESQLLVPVRTGFLRASAQTTLVTNG